MSIEQSMNRRLRARPKVDQPLEAASTQETNIEKEKDFPLDAVAVCGMGPVSLQRILGSDRAYPASPFARRNAQAAKLLRSHRLADKIIVSGFRSSKIPEGKNIEDLSSHRQKEVTTSEATLLADTYDRMSPTSLPLEERKLASSEAVANLILEEEALTSVDNIIQAVNMLDDRDGHFQGKFGVLSSEFHIPRVQESLKALGIQAAVLSADRVMRHYGYEHINPREAWGMKFEELEGKTYEAQPAGLENLQDNPAYIVAELAKFKSDQRLHEAANSLKQYYEEKISQAREQQTGKQIILPDFFNELPITYDDSFDYQSFRHKCAQIKFTKHAYTGNLNAAQYKELASGMADATDNFIQQHDTEGSPYSNFSRYAQELANIISDHWLQNKADRYRTYCIRKEQPLPEELNDLPVKYDANFDYDGLREKLRTLSYT